MISNEFISDCISGNEGAIQTLIRTHQRSVFLLALSVLDHADAPIEEAAGQAEIATREVFITALERISRYREDMPFQVWLNHITIQVSRKRARRWRRERRFGSFWSHLSRASTRAATRGPSGEMFSESDQALWHSVRSLNERLRLPVVLRYYHDLPVNEIATTLNLSEGAVHARLDKAREILIQANPEM